MTKPEPPPRPAYWYLKGYLDRHEYSYSRFAASIGYDNSFIADVCNGKGGISAELASAIAKAHPKISALGLLVAQAKWQLHEIELHGPTKKRQGRRRNPLTLEQEEAVCRDRQEHGLSIRDLARKHDSTYNKVRTVLAERGLLDDEPA